MTRDFFSIGTAIGLLATTLSPAVRADEGYLLGGELPAGTTVDWSSHREADLQVKIQSSDGESQDKENIVADWKGRLNVAAPDKAAFEVTGAAVKRHLDPEPAAELHSALSKGGQYLFEKEGGTWTEKHKDGSRVERMESNELGTIDLAVAAELDALIFGTTPRRPGDHWEVPVKRYPILASLEHVTGTITVEFVEIAKVSEIDCATIKSHMDVEGIGPTGVKTHLKSDTTEHRSLADKFVVDSKTEGTMEYSGKATSGDTVSGSGTTRTVIANEIHHS